MYKSYFTILVSVVLTLLVFRLDANGPSIDKDKNTEAVGPPFHFYALTGLETNPGDVVCIDIFADGFENVLSFQYGVEFDPTVLQFVNGSSPVFAQGDFFASLPVTGDPIVSASYGSITATPFSVNDGAEIFTLCFQVIGSIGDCSPISFTDIAAGQGPATSVSTNVGEFFPPDDVTFASGEVCIVDNSEDIEVEMIPISASCDGSPSGSLEIIITGGVSPYFVFVQDCATGDPAFGPTTLASSVVINNLAAGDYCLCITDNENPSNTWKGDTTIMQGVPPVIIGYDSLSVSCPGAQDGQLQVLVQETGSPIDTYEWEDAVGNSYSGNPIQNINGGDYTVTVTAVDGCTVVESVSLFAPTPFEIDVANSVVTDPECTGFGNGSLIVAISGGTAPYTFDVNGQTTVGGTGTVFGQLVANDYVVTVVDANGCGPATFTFTLTDPDPIEVTFTGVEDVSCNGQPPFDGGATACATNGPEAVYSYFWESLESSLDVACSSAMQLEQGWQSVTVTSGNCSVIDSVEILAPPILEVLNDQTTIQNVACFGGDDGMISVTAGGGVPGYTYAWNHGPTTSMVDNLSVGLYSVIIRDANNCTVPLVVEISQPDSLDAFIVDENTQNISCGGESDGLLVAAFTGGNGNVTYEWSSGPNDNLSTNTGLSAGDYIVTVTDINGCQDTAMATLDDPLEVMAVIPQPMDPTCFGQQTFVSVDNASGGSGGPYTFTVNAGPAVPIGGSIPVFAGEYTVTVFDVNGCRTSEEIDINEPTEVVVNAGQDLEVDLGDDIGLLVQIQSSLAIDSIFWTPDSLLSCANCTNPTASVLNSQLFTVGVIDANGCTAFDEVYVEVDKDRNVYFPNVFSPNGDGINDYFSPFTGPGVEQINYFKIFDKWGEIVHLQEEFLPGGSEFAFGWDGKLRGKRAAVGVYLYLAEVTFIDGTTLLYRGDVTIVQY